MPFSRVLNLFVVLAAPLCLTGCGLLTGLINTVLGVGVQAAQVKLIYRCVPEGTAIDTPEGPRKIEELRVGDAVIGFDGSAVKVLQKHEYLEADAAERFMRVTFDESLEVRVCDMHRIGGRRSMNLQPGDSIEGHVVSDISRYGGVAVSYDLLTEDAGYRINGIPVNSMIEEMGAAIQRRAGTESAWSGRKR
ncbi:MAG: Hint domain-containing protein [Verrucomicrobiales bacterium]